jgi:hypothetical protein
MNRLMQEPITRAIIRRIQRALLTHPGASADQLGELTGYPKSTEHLLGQITGQVFSIEFEGRKCWYLKRNPRLPNFMAPKISPGSCG